MKLVSSINHVNVHYESRIRDLDGGYIWITVNVGLDSQVLLTLTEETLVLLNHLPLDPLQKDGSHIINPNISHGFDF